MVYGASQYGGHVRVIVTADLPPSGGVTQSLAMTMAGAATVAPALTTRAPVSMAMTMAGTSALTDALTVRPIINMAMLIATPGSTVDFDMRQSPEPWYGKPITPLPRLTVRVYDRNLNFVGLVPSRLEPAFTDQMGQFGEGVGTFKVNANAPELASTPHLLDYDNIVVMHDSLSNYYYPFIIEKRNRVTISDGEQGADEITVSGRGALALLADSVLYSEAWALNKPVTDNRTFSFASKASAWYTASEWVAPAGVVWSDETSARRRSPRGWPDPTAMWIWYGSATNPNTVSGYCYFRTTLNITTAARVSMFCTADNAFDLYVDGELVMSGNSWKVYQRFDIDLGVGPHVIAIRGYNSAQAGGNPAGVLFTAYTSDPSSGKLLTKIRRSETTNWLTRSTSLAAPGWDPGDILNVLVKEGKDRGVNTAFAKILCYWTANADSAGQAWASNQRGNRTFQVGTDLLNLARQLSENVCDLRMNWKQGMDTDHRLRLQLFKKLGVDRTIGANNVSGKAIVLRKTLNAVNATYDGDNSGTRTSLLIKTDKGWQEEISASYGAVRRESFVSLGSTEDAATATQTATSAFELVGKAVETIQTQAIPVTNHVPFKDFMPGDYVWVPDSSGALAKNRVVAITLGEDQDGNVSYTPEFSTVPHNKVVRATRWLKSMADGTLGGRLSIASPAVLPSITSQLQGNVKDVPFTFFGTLTGATSPYYKMRDDGTLFELACLLQVAGSTDTVCYTRTNGVRDQQFTIPAGQTTVLIPLEIFYNQNDNLQIEIATPGTGASGLTVQAWFS